MLQKERASLFIVFEGGEGAGKTTAVGALADALRARGRDVLLTREPGGTPEGLALRALLLAADGPSWDAAAELLLMTAARVQHVQRVIQPALDAGRMVLCDRFIGSTLAYQGAGRGLDQDFIRDLHRRAVGGLQPGLTVLLDIDPAIGLARSRRRLGLQQADEARFEALDRAFHARVRASFLAQAAQSPTLVIDAVRPAQDVEAAVIDGVSARLTAATPAQPFRQANPAPSAAPATEWAPAENAQPKPR